MTWSPDDRNDWFGGETASERLEREERQRAASWASMSEADVRAKVRALDGHPFRAMLGRMLATAVRRNCRQHLHLLPLEWQRDQAPKGPVANDNGGKPAA